MSEVRALIKKKDLNWVFLCSDYSDKKTAIWMLNFTDFTLINSHSISWICMWWFRNPISHVILSESAKPPTLRGYEFYIQKFSVCRSGDNSDAGWGEWGPWGPCSVSCGGGQQIRTRQCDRGNGECEGTGKMARACGTQPCRGENMHKSDLARAAIHVAC